MRRFPLLSLERDTRFELATFSLGLLSYSVLRSRWREATTQT